MAEQASYKEVNEFIKRELDKHGEWLVKEFVYNLTKNGNIDTGTLINSLTHETFDPENGAVGMKITSDAENTLYGRFFEIAGRKRKVSKMPVNVNRIVWGIRNRPTKRKKTRWYNKTMFEGFGSLVARLSAGISDDELRRIRKAMAESVNENVKITWNDNK